MNVTKYIPSFREAVEMLRLLPFISMFSTTWPSVEVMMTLSTFTVVLICMQINTTVKVERVIITSTLGQVVENIEMNGNNLSISTASLNDGMYFVTFIGDGGTRYVQKLMKN